MQTPRINVGKLSQIFIVSLVLPFGAVVVVDQVLGTAPLLTIMGIAICFPLASFVVMRAVLREMGRVIDEVAPKQTALPDAKRDPDETPVVSGPNSRAGSG
jgi:hypothetical protein